MQLTIAILNANDTAREPPIEVKRRFLNNNMLSSKRSCESLTWPPLGCCPPFCARCGRNSSEACRGSMTPAGPCSTRDSSARRGPGECRRSRGFGHPRERRPPRPGEGEPKRPAPGTPSTCPRCRRGRKGWRARRRSGWRPRPGSECCSRGRRVGPEKMD